MKYLLILVTVSICLSFAKGYDGLDSVDVTNSDSLTFILELNKTDYSIPDSIIERYPYGKQNNINRFFPGVVSYFQNFYIRGGENYETGFFIDEVKFNDLFTGNNAFFINPNVFNKIDYYNGFIPMDFINTSAGLFNYKLKTGGDKINFNAEYLTDNITFTYDAFSGDKRLGAYYYGYNETNLNFGGPLYFQNVRFFANVNYLFQRDKNPQRYPGAANLLFYDQISSDSVIINLPEGIVPYNSFESTNFLLTLLFDFDKIKVNASGIYFDEDSFVERNHNLEYLNPRLGLIDKTGGLINLSIGQEINETISYSIKGSYFWKNEETTDQYLGDNYWAYGDSAANAEAGIVWQRDDFQYGRYKLPSKKQIMSWNFPSSGFPGIDHQKSEQQKLALSGFFKVKIKNHEIRIGGDFVQQKLRFWEIFAQRNLAAAYASYREDPQFQRYTEEELKELIAIEWGVNNFGFDPIGIETNSGLYEAPSPVQYSVYLDDQFNLFKKLVLYLGLKYDHFDFDYMKMIDPAAPEKTFDRTTLEVNESGLTQANPYSLLSPKLSIEYFLQNNFSMIANYVQNVQSHPANFIYCGIHRLASYLTPGLLSAYFPIPTGDIDPLVTNLIELKLTYSPPERFKTLLTGYYKKTSNYLSLEYQYVNPNSPFTSYYYLGNNNEMDIWGMEFLFDYYLKDLI